MLLFRRTTKVQQSLIPLEVTIHPRGPHQSENWQIFDGKTLTKIFPSAPPSIKSIQSQGGKKKEKIIDKTRLKEIRVRRTLPHFDSQLQKGISKLSLRQRPKTTHDLMTTEYIGVAKSSVRCLNRIFKDAKNLTSVTMEPDCGSSTFKAIQKIHGLKDLTLKTSIRRIKELPQFFKRMVQLQRVNLTINSEDQWRSKMIPILNKFLGYLLSLPRLEHVTIRLEECDEYFKTLLEQLHVKKFASFHIIVANVREFSRSSQVSYRNYIDTLSLGPSKDIIASSPQKRLSLETPGCFNADLIDLMEGSTTLKNLYVNEFSFSQNCPNLQLMRPFLVVISRAKALKNLTLFFRVIEKGYGEMTCDFIRQIVEKESLEGLESFTCQIHSDRKDPIPLPLLYNPKMRSLKSLHIILNCLPSTNDISYLVESLEHLTNLENLQLDYLAIKNENKITCNFSLEGLTNLRSLSLNFDSEFSEISRNKLIDCIMEIPGLKSLFISSKILDNVGKDQAVRLREGLLLKESLESAEFAWREEGAMMGSRVCMKRVDGKIILSENQFS